MTLDPNARPNFFVLRPDPFNFKWFDFSNALSQAQTSPRDKGVIRPTDVPVWELMRCVYPGLDRGDFNADMIIRDHFETTEQCVEGFRIINGTAKRSLPLVQVMGAVSTERDDRQWWLGFKTGEEQFASECRSLLIAAITRGDFERWFLSSNRRPKSVDAVCPNIPPLRASAETDQMSKKPRNLTGDREIKIANSKTKTNGANAAIGAMAITAPVPGELVKFSATLCAQSLPNDEYAMTRLKAATEALRSIGFELRGVCLAVDPRLIPKPPRKRNLELAEELRRQQQTQRAHQTEILSRPSR